MWRHQKKKEKRKKQEIHDTGSVEEYPKERGMEKRTKSTKQAE
ncbi:hypothetical protein KSS87_022006 [Heliosperma pusillum]|nr:hypothetical protein KSS87_022006 [Heliosperma pusillum]